MQLNFRTQPSILFPLRKVLAFSLATSFAILTIGFSSCGAIGQNDQQDDIPAEAEQLNHTAATLQKEGEYELAITNWKALLGKFPDTPISNRARHNLGICYQKEDQFQNAIDIFEQAIAKAKNEIDISYLPDNYLLKAFCEYSLAKTLNDEEAAAKLYADSIKSYDSILEKFPDSKIADQAHYFKGEAQYKSGNVDQAIDSYTKVVSEFPESKQHENASFNLAKSYYEVGDFENAIKSNNNYLKDYPDGKWVNQVRIDIPSAEIQLALAAANAGEIDQADGLFKSAELKLAELASDENYSGRDEALYKQAFCAMRQQQFETAAKLFATVAENYPESERAADSAISAGRFYFKAEKYDEAEKWLIQSENANNEFSKEATHWLCRIGIINGTDLEATFDKALQAYDTDKQNPIAFNFLFDAGDALFKIPARQQEAAIYYTQAADEFPQHERVAEALYNAAFTLVKSGENEKSIELADRFVKDFASSEFYPDVREIKAEALRLTGDPEAAEKIYRDIISKHESHLNFEKWNNQVGLLRVIMKDYDGSIAWLRPLVDQFKDPNMKTEALYRIGYSQFQLQQFDKAKTAAEEAIAVNSNWPLLDEVHLLLGRSKSKLGDTEGAVKTLTDLKTTFANSKLMDEVDFRIGEAYFDQGEYEKAREAYQASIDAGDSIFVPNAIYGLGWIDMVQKNHAEAIKHFDNVIDKFPDHVLAVDAIGNRGRILRQSGEPQKAMQDFDVYLKSDDITEENEVAMTYERGLAEVALKDWKAAIDTFSTLLEIAPNSELADKFYFELGWAQKANDDDQGSFESFAKLVDKFPQSPLAAESHFRVAINDLRNENYQEALDGFTKCRDTTTSQSIKEKAMFNLAWCHFHLEQFDDAHEAFEAQAKEFSEGELTADALSMIAESLFKSDKHELAVTAYKVAIPEIKKSATATPGIELSSRLHGAQAANLSQDYKAALEFAEPIVENNSEWEFAPETWYEIGAAHFGLGDTDNAVKAWEKTVGTFNQTGARARFMIGETLFAQKKHDEAIQQFKLVIYGYGGELANDQVKQWQANSAYEAARCSFVRISSTEDKSEKAQLIEEASKLFTVVINKFPDSSFVDDARKNLKTLQSMQ